MILQRARARLGSGFRGVFAALAALVFLAGCAGEGVWAPESAVQAARYVHGGQAELTIVTVMNYRTKRGDHTAMFINADERVLFDPAGSWTLAEIPERNDLHYGITPRIGASFYMSHTRETHYTVVQRIPVSMETAMRAKQLAAEAGPVPPAHCAVSTARILRELPGFEGISAGYFPHNLMQQIAQLPNVMTYELHFDAPQVLSQVYAAQSQL